MNAQPRPFDDFRALIKRMPEPDTAAVDAARARQAELTKPAGSLGRLEEIAEWLAGWQGGRARMSTRRWSPSSPAITASSPGAFRLIPPRSPRRWSPISPPAARRSIRSARPSTFRCKVFELALEQPTGDITREAGARRADLRGDDGLRHGGARRRSRPAVPGRNGHRQHHAPRRRSIMRSTAARRRIGSAAAPASTTPALRRKVEAVRAAVALHREHLERSARSSAPARRTRDRGDRRRDPRRAHPARAGAARRLRRLLRRGGPARARSRPRSTIASPATSRPRTPHAEVLRRLGKTPLLDLGMRLGEGSGAALAVGIVKAAVACHNGMATFAEAGVAGKDES